MSINFESRQRVIHRVMFHSILTTSVLYTIVCRFSYFLFCFVVVCLFPSEILPKNKIDPFKNLCAALPGDFFWGKSL